MQPHPVKTAICERGWTQRSVAEQIGLSPKILYGVLQYRNASWPKLRRELADLLELPEDELFPPQLVTIR